MSISNINSQSALQVQSLVAMRRQLDDLQRQLGTGKRANDYAGIGLDRGLTVGLRTQLSAIASFGSSIDVLGTRLQISQTALTDIDAAARMVKSAIPQSAYVIDQTGHTTEQNTARSQLDRILSALNARFGDQYIFSGQGADQPATDTIDHILDGDGARAGFRQVMNERNQADLGVDGLGRLVIPAATTAPAALTGAGATLAPDASAVVPGSADLTSPPFSSAGGTLDINGVTITINPGDNDIAIRDAINTAMAGAPPGTALVSASLNGSNQLELTSADADTAITIGGGSTPGLLTELGLSTGTTDPTNLLTQVPPAATAGQTLTIGLGAPGTSLTVVFGTGPGEVSTLAELNSALAGMADASASVNLTNGNISVSSAYPITISGTATAANFGLTATSAAPVDAISVSEDVAGSSFGFKLAAATTTIAGATVTGPAGSPPGLTVDLAGNQPAVGDTVTLTFNLPDGTSEVLTLRASTNNPPGENEFSIGADAATTIGNLQTKLTGAVGKLAQTALSAASAIAAAGDFFDVDAANPPLRVDGPPFDAATGLIAGTPANTVTWYTGEAGALSARETAVTRIDTAMSVSYGMRANEQALRTPVANLAAFAAMTFSASDPNGQERYVALTQRLQANFSEPAGTQKIADIEAELGGAQAALGAAKDRHTQTKAALTDLLQDVEGAPIEEVGAQILAVQTSLQASLQTAALLANLSLVNYL